jgi:hypothetical protein
MRDWVWASMKSKHSKVKGHQSHSPLFKNPKWSSKAAATTTTRDASHCGLAIYIKKYLKEKKKNYGNSNISPCKNIIFKNSSKTNQNPSRYFNSITDLKFQHKPKYHLSKILR